MTYFLDTCVCVSLIRGRSTTRSLPEVADCVVSVISAAELEIGILRSSRQIQQRQAVNHLLEFLRVLSFEISAVAEYGRIRHALEQQGTPIGALDLLIAAHATSLNAAVVTGNVREFRRVPGLKVVPWL